MGQATKAWLMLAVGDDRQHGGNDGYDDQPDVHYSWDSTVPNHRAVSVGDRVVLWDKRVVIGASIIDEIETRDNKKLLYRCRDCKMAGIKARRTRTPRFKCYKCMAVFDEPSTRIQKVCTYRSRHDASWTELDGCLGGDELRALCESPNSQLSIRPLRWDDFQLAIVRAGCGELLAGLESQVTALAGGHRDARVR